MCAVDLDLEVAVRAKSAAAENLLRTVQSTLTQDRQLRPLVAEQEVAVDDLQAKVKNTSRWLSDIPQRRTFHWFFLGLLFVWLFVYLTVCPSVRLSVWPSGRLAVWPSGRLAIWLSARLPACPPARQSASPPILLPVHPPARHPPIRPSVHPSFRVQNLVKDSS